MSKVESVTDIKTDVIKNTCRFRVSKDVDIAAKLAQLAESNEHLKDYEITSELPKRPSSPDLESPAPTEPAPTEPASAEPPPADAADAKEGTP